MSEKVGLMGTLLTIDLLSLASRVGTRVNELERGPSGGRDLSRLTARRVRIAESFSTSLAGEDDVRDRDVDTDRRGPFVSLDARRGPFVSLDAHREIASGGGRGSSLNINSMLAGLKGPLLSRVSCSRGLEDCGVRGPSSYRTILRFDCFFCRRA